MLLVFLAGGDAGPTFAPSTRPKERLNDVGGIDKYRQSLLELFAFQIFRPDIFQRMGTELPRGILVHGPSGCGKVRALRYLHAPFNIIFISNFLPSLQVLASLLNAQLASFCCCSIA